MTLRNLIEDAQQAVRMYKHPSISECHAKLNEILVAADLGGIVDDKITFLDVDDDRVCIETEWSARGCMNSSDYEFPTHIIDSDDPIMAAKRWGWDQKVNRARDDVNGAQISLEQAEARLEKIIREAP